MRLAVRTAVVFLLGVAASLAAEALGYRLDPLSVAVGGMCVALLGRRAR